MKNAMITVYDRNPLPNRRIACANSSRRTRLPERSGARARRQFRASTWVNGCTYQPGMFSITACVPVPITTFLPRSNRFVPSAESPPCLWSTNLPCHDQLGSAACKSECVSTSLNHPAFSISYDGILTWRLSMLIRTPRCAEHCARPAPYE